MKEIRLHEMCVTAEQILLFKQQIKRLSMTGLYLF